MALGLASVVAAVVEICFGDDAERADGGEHPALRAVDFVHTIAFSHRPAITSGRQVEVPGEHVARIAISAKIGIAGRATASAASTTEVVAVAAVRRARIVSVPHDRRLVAEHHEILVTLATLLPEYANADRFPQPTFASSAGEEGGIGSCVQLKTTDEAQMLRAIRVQPVATSAICLPGRPVEPEQLRHGI